MKKEARTNPAAPKAEHPIDQAKLKPALTTGLPRFTPALITGFNGLPDLSRVEPPDMALAVSPSFVLQAVNLNVTVLSRTGVTQTGFPKSFVNFFHIPSPGSCDPTPFTSDPRAFYDRVTQRFFVAVLQLDGPLIGTSCAPLSKYWVAVSATNNPTGLWHIYAFDMRAGTTNVADFTQIGYDANGFYFSGNMFSSTGSFQYAEIFGVSKSALEAGSAVTPHGFAGAALGATVQPVDSFTQPKSGTTVEPVEFFVASTAVCSSCSGVKVWALANGATATPTLSGVTLPTHAYAFPPDGYQTIANFPINTDDSRISGTPVFNNGVITFGLNTGVFNGVTRVPGILWEQETPVLTAAKVTGGTQGQNGIVAFSGSGSAYYPAFVPNAVGGLFLTFGMSSISQNPSALYAVRRATDPVNTFETPVIMKAGGNFYFGGRWGDYSAAAFDGIDSWMSAEYAGTNDDWFTFIGESV